MGGLVLVCLTLVLAGSGATAQRARVIEAITTRTLSQVEVVNFPAVQQVAGTVNIANLPPTCLAAIHFVGTTTALFPFVIGPDSLGVYTYFTRRPLAMSRSCNLEFPGTRACYTAELYKSIPPPPDFGTDVFVLNLDAIEGDIGSCISPDGAVCFGLGAQPSHPVACCGY
jgi:hypothetical protein